MASNLAGASVRADTVAEEVSFSPGSVFSFEADVFDTASTFSFEAGGRADAVETSLGKTSRVHYQGIGLPAAV